MTEDLWRCEHCHDPFVVPSLAREHEKTCPARPAQEAK